MKPPRDVSGDDLAKRLQVFGYQISRQVGSHLRLTTTHRREHHLTIPRHDFLKVGTLAGILGDVGEHFDLSRDEVIARVFFGK
jgi:predicted RNA binding protein YcfA (HicA-like mRNA interferase family)